MTGHQYKDASLRSKISHKFAGSVRKENNPITRLAWPCHPKEIFLRITAKAARQQARTHHKVRGQLCNHSISVRYFAQSLWIARGQFQPLSACGFCSPCFSFVPISFLSFFIYRFIDLLIYFFWHRDPISPNTTPQQDSGTLTPVTSEQARLVQQLQMKRNFIYRAEIFHTTVYFHVFRLYADGILV